MRHFTSTQGRRGGELSQEETAVLSSLIFSRSLAEKPSTSRGRRTRDLECHAHLLVGQLSDQAGEPAGVVQRDEIDRPVAGKMKIQRPAATRSMNCCS